MVIVGEVLKSQLWLGGRSLILQGSCRYLPTVRHMETILTISGSSFDHSAFRAPFVPLLRKYKLPLSLLSCVTPVCLEWGVEKYRGSTFLIFIRFSGFPPFHSFWITRFYELCPLGEELLQQRLRQKISGPHPRTGVSSEPFAGNRTGLIG